MPSEAQRQAGITAAHRWRALAGKRTAGRGLGPRQCNPRDLQPTHEAQQHEEKNTCFWTYLVKAALESSLLFGAVVPFAIHDPEGKVFVRRAGDETDKASILLASGGKRLALAPAVFPDDLESRGLGFVDEIRVKDVESVALDDLGRGVVMVVVGLVVLVPLVSHEHAVEVARLPGPVLVSPEGLLEARNCFFGGEDLLALADSPRDFAVIQRLGGL